MHTIPVGSSPSDIGTGAGAVWVADTLDGTVSRIDPSTERVVRDDYGRTPADRGDVRRRLGLGDERG